MSTQTPQQTSKPETQTQPQILTAADVPTNNLADLLDQQVFIDSTSDVYVPVEETNIPRISLSSIQPGTLIYDPHESDAVLEVLEQYEDDFGKEKVRVKLHTNDYRNERMNSYFATHIRRDFTYLQAEDVSDVSVELSAEVRTSTWDGTISSEDDNGDIDEMAQATFSGSSETELTENSDSSSSSATEDSDTVQQTLF